MSDHRSIPIHPQPVLRSIADHLGAATPGAGAIDQIEDKVEEVSEPATREVAQSTAEWLREQNWILPLTKLGWVAKAVVYWAMGWAALIISVRWPMQSTDGDANYTGIVSMMADQTWSRIVLGIIAAGLLFYVIFRLISVLLIDTGDIEAWAHRVAYLVSVGTYLVLAWAALSGALSGRHEDGRSSVERYSSDLLTTTPGRIVIGLGALGALAVAAFFVHKGVTRSFTSQLDLAKLSERKQQLLTLAGAIGWIGRAVLVAAVAVFLLWAAITADPSDARGLDRALQKLAFESTAGTWAVFATGVFLIFWAFCLASAPVRRLAWSHRCDPDDDRPVRRP